MMTANTGYPASDPLFRHLPARLDIELLCKEYDLGDLVKIHEDLGGLYNVNLKIESTKGSYVIRIASGLANTQHIEFTSKVISILQEEKIPVLAPIKNEQGKFYSKYKDRFVQVTPYINAHPFKPTNKHAHSSGRMLRKIHETLIAVESGPLPEWSNYPSEEVLNEGLTLLKEICTIPDYQLSRVERLHERVSRNWNQHNQNLPTTIIHGDWHMWNSLYDTDGEIVVVMDFDFIQHAERLHDIAYMLWALLPNRKSNHLGKAFLEGYGNISQTENIGGYGLSW
jgi:Ser/Thr protein kinase RdoA (MazF antagonist)